MSKMIDGHSLIMTLSDWWYSSFGQEETEESKAIRKVLDEVEKYVEGYPTWKGEWIPFTYHKPTEEEKEWARWDYILDGTLPSDGEEILITVSYKGHQSVQFDTACFDADEFYLDSSYEVGTEAIAWMPLPEPWKEKANENR